MDDLLRLIIFYLSGLLKGAFILVPGVVIFYLAMRGLEVWLKEREYDERLKGWWKQKRMRDRKRTKR